MSRPGLFLFLLFAALPAAVQALFSSLATTSVNFVQSASVGGVVEVTATLTGSIIPERLFVAVEATNE